VALEMESDTGEKVQTSNLYYEEIIQLRASFQRMEEMHRTFGEDFQLVKKNCDKLWGITAKSNERLEAIEHNSMRIQKHLELAVAQAAKKFEDNFDQKLKDNLMLQQPHVEEQFKILENEVN